jgi:type I restriction enzyme S subunit
VAWLGDVPEHWETWQISHFAKIGNGSTPSRGNSGYWSGGHYPWLNSASVNKGKIAAADQFVTDLALRECHLPRVQPGSVLVAITGQGKTRGTAALLEIEATINQHIAYITPMSAFVAPNYLQMYLTAAYPELRRISDDSGSTKGALTCENVKRFRIVVPPIEEQQRLVNTVQKELVSVEAMTECIQRQVVLVSEYRTRLIADVVTGKLDVRAAAAALPEEEAAPEVLAEAPDEAEEGDESVPEDEEIET